ncbi:MAG: DHH family phosphoesterase [Promethearchaeota archaeon]
MAYLEYRDKPLREKEFLDKLKEVAGIFYDLSSEIEHLLIIAHQDADGFASAALLDRMAAREKIPHSIFYYNRKGTWYNYLNNQALPPFDKYERFCVIFVDLGAEVEEIARVFKDDYAHVFILDHHEIVPYDHDKLQETIHVLNPTEYGYDGLKEIAGATLAHLFCKEISLKNIKNAWIALIGISNDTLMNVLNYKSFNKEVLEEAIAEEQVILKHGLMVYGATHERVKNALAHSIFPFIKELKGNVQTSQEILEDLKIDPNKKVEDLTEDEVDIIDAKFNENLKGAYIIFPHKKSILRYAFEHGLLMSISGFKHSRTIQELINLPNSPAMYKKEYNNYIKMLVKNIAMFVKTPKEYTKHTIFVDAGKRIPSNFWADVASYCSVNGLYNSDKILFLGGKDGSQIKLSVRCSEYFPPLKNGKGVDTIIKKLKQQFGGIGGGHKLAGGYKVAPNKFKKLKENIDQFFPL